MSLYLHKYTFMYIFNRWYNRSSADSFRTWVSFRVRELYLKGNVCVRACIFIIIKPVVALATVNVAKPIALKISPLKWKNRKISMNMYVPSVHALYNPSNLGERKQNKCTWNWMHSRCVLSSWLTYLHDLCLYPRKLCLSYVWREMMQPFKMQLSHRRTRAY